MWYRKTCENWIECDECFRLCDSWFFHTVKYVKETTTAQTQYTKKTFEQAPPQRDYSDLISGIGRKQLCHHLDFIIAFSKRKKNIVNIYDLFRLKYTHTHTTHTPLSTYQKLPFNNLDHIWNGDSRKPFSYHNDLFKCCFSFFLCVYSKQKWVLSNK